MGDDPTRRAILRLVCDDGLPDARIAEHFPTISRPAVSHTCGSSPMRDWSRLGLTPLTADGDDTILALRHTGLPRSAGNEHRRRWGHFRPQLAAAAGTTA